MAEKIVAAARRIDGLTVTLPPPARHHSILHPLNRLIGARHARFVEQGFITDAGRYVDRQDAAMIACAAGQTTPCKMVVSDRLFSEDLW